MAGSRISLLTQLLKAAYEKGKEELWKQTWEHGPTVAAKAKDIGLTGLEKGLGVAREYGTEPVAHHAASTALGIHHGDDEEHGGTKAMIADILAQMAGVGNIAAEATVHGMKHLGTPIIPMLRAGVIPTASHVGKALSLGAGPALSGTAIMQGMAWDALHPKPAGESSDLIQQAMQSDRDEAYARYLANMASRNVVPRYKPTFEDLAQRRNGLY